MRDFMAILDMDASQHGTRVRDVRNINLPISPQLLPGHRHAGFSSSTKG